LRQNLPLATSKNTLGCQHCPLADAGVAVGLGMKQEQKPLDLPEQGKNILVVWFTATTGWLRMDGGQTVAYSNRAISPYGILKRQQSRSP